MKRTQLCKELRVSFKQKEHRCKSPELGTSMARVKEALAKSGQENS